MPTTYSGLVALILNLINYFIMAIFGFAFLYFIWKMIDCWVLNAADEKKQEAGRQYAVSAVLVFVIMISAWGIVQMIKSSIFG